MLSFQKLRVYQRSIEFLALTMNVIAPLPKGNADLVDQLLRAAQSHAREDELTTFTSKVALMFKFMSKSMSRSTLAASR